MCGFAGELAADGAADVAAVARMAATMSDRGPDGAGAWAHGRIALGHRRLKVIDLSERASQPMVDPELGLAIVFNGIIYNHRELRGDLAADGYRFFSSGDTEVVLKAYHRWGERCVDRFLGMFAFAVAERDTGRVVLARDRLGVKPLYLADVGGSLRFASTLPALLAGGDVDTRIDPVALHHYLTWHGVVPAPRTILEGVRKLSPATVMTVEPDGRRRSRTYWAPSYTRDHADAAMSAHDWTEAVLASLRTAVQRRTVSDVPVGVLLSGGLDSSLIVALLAEAGQGSLQTFSVGFSAAGGREGDEFVWSDQVASRFGTDHHRIEVPDERLLDAVPAAIHAMSEPMVSHDAVAFLLLAEQVSRSVKVVQSGQGADEVFGGYSWYQPLAGARADGFETYVAEFFDRPHERESELVGARHRLATDPSTGFALRHFLQPGAETPVDRALRLDTHVMLVDDPVKRVDNMTMAYGLETRTPFLDHELVELAARCPPELKLAHDGKGVLKEAARSLLPEDVVFRPKGYFPVPALRHLEGPYLRLVADALDGDVARERGLFDPATVQRLLADPNGNPTTLGGNTLWQVGVLELWLQSHGVAPA